MIKTALSSIILLALAATVSCGNKLAFNPNPPSSFYDFDLMPWVVSTSPDDNENDVPASKIITAVFSEPVDCASVSLSSFILADAEYLTVDGTFCCSEKTVEFIPGSPLANLNEYNVLITQDITDLEGNRLASEKILYFRTISAGPVPDPVFEPAADTYVGPQTVAIKCFDPLATIRFTSDGTLPSPTNGTVYTAPFTVDTIPAWPYKAIAYRTGFTNSSVSEAAYVIQAHMPQTYPPAGIYSSDQMVALSTLTPGATILYTTDLSDPATSPSASVYTGPFGVTGPDSPVTILAVATAPNLAASPVLSADFIINYSQVAPPVFDPPSGTYTRDFVATLSSATVGACIKYTTDGTDPLIFGIEGGELVSLDVTDSMTITAIAYDPALVLSNSDVMTGTYIMAPVVNSTVPNKGPNYQPISVTITGTHFKPGLIVRLKRLTQADIIATSVVLTGETTITCILDITGAVKGKWNLVVANPDAETLEKNEFRVY